MYVLPSHRDGLIPDSDREDLVDGEQGRRRPPCQCVGRMWVQQLGVLHEADDPFLNLTMVHPRRHDEPCPGRSDGPHVRSKDHTPSSDIRFRCRRNPSDVWLAELLGFLPVVICKLVSSPYMVGWHLCRLCKLWYPW